MKLQLKQIILWFILCTGVFIPLKKFAEGPSEIDSTNKYHEEKVVKKKIDEAVNSILNPALFYTISRAIIEKENPAKIAKFHVTILIDKQGVLKLPNVQALPEKFKQVYLFHLEQDLNKEILTILNEIPIPIEKKISFVDFRKPPVVSSKNPLTFLQLDFLPLAAFILGIFLLYPVWGLIKKFLSNLSIGSNKPAFTRHNEAFTINDVLNKAHPSALMPYFLNESMHSVVLLLFPLTEKRVSEILQVWPLEKQVSFFIALSELEGASDSSLIKKTFELLNIEGYPKQFDEFAVGILNHLPANIQNVLHEKILAAGLNTSLIESPKV